jgi:hypothetical protein
MMTRKHLRNYFGTSQIGQSSSTSSNCSFGFGASFRENLTAVPSTENNLISRKVQMVVNLFQVLKREHDPPQTIMRISKTSYPKQASIRT